MTSERRLEEDRRLRDAARAVVTSDIAHIRAGLSGEGIASRVAGRVGDGARDVFETARDKAEDNQGIVAALVGALILWFARGPILGWLNGGGRADDAAADDEIEDDEIEDDDLRMSEPDYNLHPVKDRSTKRRSTRPS
ncbi:MAG: hypothetical protein V2J51_12975 [Erythrobacter sp.]|jgi:hypothetical protein|nr:hypothetical protein [Erythrobacter sp.]